MNWPSKGIIGVATEVSELALKGNHRVSFIRNCNSIESGDTAWDLIGAQKAKDTELRQSAVVQLGHQPTLLGLLGHVLVETKGIVKIKDGVDSVPEQLEAGVLPGLTSAHVMGEGAAAALVPKLEGGDDGKDLPLGTEGDGIPLLLGAQVGAGVRSAGEGLGPLPFEVCARKREEYGQNSFRVHCVECNVRAIVYMINILIAINIGPKTLTGKTKLLWTMYPTKANMAL